MKAHQNLKLKPGGRQRPALLVCPGYSMSHAVKVHVHHKGLFHKRGPWKPDHNVKLQVGERLVLKEKLWINSANSVKQGPV